jgi:hypothetical protein
MSNQNLSEQFNSILTQYQDTYQNYVSALKSANNSFINVPNTSFVGNSTIRSIPNSTIDSCITACTSDTTVSGASFNNSTNQCVLSSGTGTIVSDTTSSSIVPLDIYYNYQLQQLNSQLLSINKQIVDKVQKKQGTFQLTQQETKQLDQALINNYQSLTEQRDEINKMLRSYDSIDAAYQDGNINVTSHYYNYIVLLLITILLSFLLIKFSVTGKQSGGGNSFKKEALFLFGIMVIFLILSKILNNLHSFTFVAVILIAYLVAKIKLNQ